MNQATHTPKWIVITTLLVFVCCTALALGMLAGPLGVWLGLWPFGTAFSILGALFPFTLWIALLALCAGLGLYLAARRAGSPYARRFLVLPLIGALACAVAWYIPSSFRAPAGENYPPIHDVSTNIDDVPQFVAVLPLRADAPNTVVYGGSPNMTPERNAQLQREAYPDLVPQVYQAGRTEMFERALEAVDEMGWTLVAADQNEGRIEATATTFWLRFKDDIVIRIREGDAGTIVDARSLSRVGGGDVGTNAKRLRRFFGIL